jgi:prepilin-type N-terminal cleavage/methylation domain-containing protein/prepilin-type processing-associated H-X9-DG protein
MVDAKASRPSRPCRCAFTLAELLVVIGIIAIIIAIMLPALARAREYSKRAACLSNLRSLGHAMLMYANENRGWLPNGNAPGMWTDYAGANRIMTEFSDRYVKAAGVFYCPSDADSAPTKIVTADQTLRDSARTSFDFYSLYWAPEFGPIITQLKGQAPLAWDQDGGLPPGAWHNHARGGNVVYADGHADWQLNESWDKPNWPHPADRFFP